MTGHVVTLVDLIRHGEPVGGHRYRGQLDDPLSEKGWRQMRQAVGNHHPWQVVITSPLSRCRAFAQDLCLRYGLSLEMDERFGEIGFGCWEGLTADEIEAEWPGALMRYYADPLAHLPAGAEPLEAFRVRVAAAWEDLCGRHAGKRVFVVTHAGVIRMSLALVLGMPLDGLPRIKVDNASLTRIQCDGGGGEAPFRQLVFHGAGL